MVKGELEAANVKKPCCKLAALSAFIRTSGSLVTRGKKVGFVLYSESDIGDYFAKIIEKLFNEKPLKSENIK